MTSIAALADSLLRVTRLPEKTGPVPLLLSFATRAGLPIRTKGGKPVGGTSRVYGLRRSLSGLYYGQDAENSSGIQGIRHVFGRILRSIGYHPVADCGYSIFPLPFSPHRQVPLSIGSVFVGKRHTTVDVGRAMRDR